MIVAHDPNRLIGAEGGLPWKYSEDLKFFKRTTLGSAVIMGRKVFEEIGCKPLPGRTNVVLSRTQQYSNVLSCSSAEEALEKLQSANETSVFIIGGAALYASFLEKVDKLYVTKVLKNYSGDTYFPAYQHLIDQGHFDQGELLETHQELEMWLYKKV